MNILLILKFGSKEKYLKSILKLRSMIRMIFLDSFWNGLSLCSMYMICTSDVRTYLELNHVFVIKKFLIKKYTYN